MTVTDEAIEFLKGNPSTMAKIATKMSKSLSTLQTWFYRSPEKFATPAIAQIIATDMGKKVAEILIEPAKTEA